MRGAYAAAYLDSMASAAAKRRDADVLDIGAGFNMIVGTSSGGIIACALAKGVALQDVVNLYREYGPRVFSRKLPKAASAWGAMKIICDLFRRQKSLQEGEVALREALKKMLGKLTIADVFHERNIALAITAVEMSRHAGWVFKTPHFDGTNHRDDNFTLVDVCLSTSAAPVYRSIANVSPKDNGESRWMFVDGGLWANNPVMIALLEALDVAEVSQPIEIFCLGTCPKPAGENIVDIEVHRGLGGWNGGGDAAMLSIDAQQFAYDHMAKKMAKQIRQGTGRECTVLRFPAEAVSHELGQYLDLDDTRPEATKALVRQAQIDANMTNSRFAYRETDPEAEMICRLFDSMPVSRKASVQSEEDPSQSQSNMKEKVQ